ncbi:hypothetical protein [Nocardioides sp.]|uniref:hypothetical protein n=1 Tax=Nocardioides sp. TaxID=35761 RepID=UPI003783FA02
MNHGPTESPLVLRLVGGDPAARQEVVDALPTSTSIDLLVAGAVITGTRTPLDRAGDLASASRDRQLVALAAAHLDGRTEVFDALVRDHLSTYPDHLLAAWIAARTPRST